MTTSRKSKDLGGRAGRAPKQILEWGGAERLAAEVSRQGFLVPSKYVHYTSAIVGLSWEDWRDELLCHAHRYVRSSGQLGDADEVSLQLEHVVGELAMNREVQASFLTQKSRWMDEETVSDPLQKDWSEKKIHLRRVAQVVAQAEGLHVTRTGYCIDLPSDLRLDVEVDAGRPGSTVRQIVMGNRLHAKDNSWSMWLPWWQILPGMERYSAGRDSADMIRGIRAFVAAGKAFASTLV
jgi:hypothetical protein